jgi:hypothetical protein
VIGEPRQFEPRDGGHRQLVGLAEGSSGRGATTLYNSIFRYDDEMLVNSHVYGTYGYMAPILHLRRVEGGTLFDTYARSFELVWGESYPIDSQAEVDPTASTASA